MIAGQGTAAVEFLADVPALDVLLIAVGGGGLLAGMATAAAHLKPSLRVIGVEPVGAATLHLQHGRRPAGAIGRDHDARRFAGAAPVDVGQPKPHPSPLRRHRVG